MTLPAVPPKVGLFVTCLVDLFRPSVGFAAIRLLEEAGCSVGVPRAQTCCGQPAYNSGDRADSRGDGAEQAITAFEGYDYVVAPSGSCAGMLSKHYPALFADDPAWRRRGRGAAGADLRTGRLPCRHLRVTERRRRAWTAPSPITIPAPACASSASSAQPRQLLAKVAASSSSRCATARSAAASAAPSASNIPTSPTRSSARRRRRSRPRAPTCCSPAISAA